VAAFRSPGFVTYRTVLAMREVRSAVRASPSALDELLSAEQEIAARLADAQRAAAAIIAAARAAAAVREQEAEAALARALAALDKRARTEREALVLAIEQEAARTVERYRSLSDTEVARLAAYVVAEVTGLGPQSVP
jgi:mannose/cellobiose epimerase-like protein (N-acyl-D-glucosamine 2-epimerase family)